MKSDGGISKLLGEYSLEHKMLLIYEKSEKFRVLVAEEGLEPPTRGL